MTRSIARRATLLLIVGILAAAAPLSAQRVTPFDVTEATIPEIQAALAAGRITSVGLVDAYLARIDAYDSRGPALNAIIRLNDRARADAAALDAERRVGKVRGPLHGVPIIMKDNYETIEGATSAGSLALADSRPGRDAFVVKRLRDAGAIILGKSNMHELAAGITTISSLGGQTRNAYDQDRCPGGSSGGTGAAIAASFAAIGWGSDTCGTIPAAYGSLVGLRPTQGLFSRAGIVPLSHTQDVPGPLARTVTDLAIALDVTVGPDPADTGTAIMRGRPLPHFRDSLSKDAFRGARIGVLGNYFTNADPAIADTVRAALRTMRSLGAELVELSIPGLDSAVNGAGLLNYDTKYDLIDYFATLPNPPVKSMREILDRGLYHAALERRFQIVDSLGTRDSEARTRALAHRAQLEAMLVHLIDSLHLDAVAYPTMRQRPTVIGEAQSGSTCGLAANSGLPAISVPAGFTGDGLPVGVELMGRPFGDAHLVSMAYAFEQSGPRRIAPSATPSLVVRPASVGAPANFTATARAGTARAIVAFAYDSSAGELAYTSRVTGVAPSVIDAVVIRRMDAAGRERVVHRLSGPGVATARGRVALTAADRRALIGGTLRLAVFTNVREVAIDEAPLTLQAPGGPGR